MFGTLGSIMLVELVFTSKHLFDFRIPSSPKILEFPEKPENLHNANKNITFSPSQGRSH